MSLDLFIRDFNLVHSSVLNVMDITIPGEAELGPHLSQVLAQGFVNLFNFDLGSIISLVETFNRLWYSFPLTYIVPLDESLELCHSKVDIGKYTFRIFQPVL